VRLAFKCVKYLLQKSGRVQVGTHIIVRALSFKLAINMRAHSLNPAKHFFLHLRIRVKKYPQISCSGTFAADGRRSKCPLIQKRVGSTWKRVIRHKNHGAVRDFFARSFREQNADGKNSFFFKEFRVAETA
jgi:hypothetical protein